MRKQQFQQKNPVTITLGVVKGVALTVDNQTVDLSKLTAQTGQITVTFTRIKEKRMKKEQIPNLLTIGRILFIPIFIFI